MMKTKSPTKTNAIANSPAVGAMLVSAPFTVPEADR